MALIRNTASALRKGKVGNETYYVALNKQIVRVAQNDSNYGETASRTQAQQSNRVKWANLVNFYKISSSWMKKAFENKKSSQTDYNRFMQLNLPLSRIYLTKEAAQAGAVVADQFAVSQGSLRSISITQLSNAWQTDIRIGNLSISATTTVAAFTAAVLANNNWAEIGMQISFISYQQSTDPFGFPKAVCTAYELTLDNADTRLVRDLLPSFCSQTKEGGFLGTDTDISIGAFAYVLSQTKSGKTLVSTQTLVTNNDAMIMQYSSAAALQAAVSSYGVTADAFLDSGSVETEATPQPLYITSMLIDGAEAPFLPGAGGPKQSEHASKDITLTLSTALPSDVTVSTVSYTLDDGRALSTSNVAVSTSRLSVTAKLNGSNTIQWISSVVVVTSQGNVELVFDNSGRIHE